jgi:hypothetical protein
LLFCFMYFSRSVLFNSITSIIVLIGFILIFSQGVQNYVYLHQTILNIIQSGDQKHYTIGETLRVFHTRCMTKI